MTSLSTQDLGHNGSRILILVPSRGRPENAEALCDTFWETQADGIADLLFCVDDDDPRLDEYLALHNSGGTYVRVGPRLRLGGTLNAASADYADIYDAIGFMGDDHVPKTPLWELRFLAELDRMGTGIVYGDDLLQGPNLPTAVLMTSDIIQSLGYMVPAGLVHMYADNAWKAWGEGIGRLAYLPEVVIEHLHHISGKAAHDEVYRDSEAQMGPDSARWEDYRLLGGLDADIERLRALASRTPEHCAHPGMEYYSEFQKPDGTRGCLECRCVRRDQCRARLEQEVVRGVAAL